VRDEEHEQDGHREDERRQRQRDGPLPGGCHDGGPLVEPHVAVGELRREECGERDRLGLDVPPRRRRQLNERDRDDRRASGLRIPFQAPAANNVPVDRERSASEGLVELAGRGHPGRVLVEDPGSVRRQEDVVVRQEERTETGCPSGIGPGRRTAREASSQHRARPKPLSTSPSFVRL
jgi:hypothetical protein